MSQEEITLTTDPAQEVIKPAWKKWFAPFLVLFLIIALDQYLKYWVKHHMVLHTEKKIMGDWFMFHFTENEGMAFGMKFFGEKGKYALTILRVLVSIFGFWYLVSHIRKGSNTWFLVCVALILGGALGNIIDCMFYGVWYQHMNEYHGGYMLGWVVDMLYFPIVETHYPSWSPIKPGQEFIFFSPVFNLADAAISTGVIAIIIFQRKFFRKHAHANPEQPVDPEVIPENTELGNTEGTI